MESSQPIQPNNNHTLTLLPTELTLDGIRQLFNSTSNQEYILQIIKIIEDYSQNKMCHLSDGFCYINCLLTGDAKLKNVKGEMEVFDVVKIRKEDVIVLGLERSPSLQLCNLTVMGMRLLCSIGEPVAYMTYAHNDYVNRKGSVVISDGQRIQNALTISDLLENFPHVPTKWILKAKVVRKPDSINVDKPFMIVRLMDDKENVIEGVFFGQVALDAHKKLVYNRQYLFNNGQVKTKKNSTTQFEIKFTEQSQIIPIETMKSTTQNSEQMNITISDITNNTNTSENKLVTVTGKVFKLKGLSKGRSIQIIDKNSDVIEIVLWEEIKDQVKEGITYIFENLRTKWYHQTVSLQSVRYKTTIKKAPYQIERQNITPQQATRKQQSTGTMTKNKQLRDPSKLSTVSDVVELSIKEKEYRDISGYLIIQTMYMDTKNFFKLQCPNCPNNTQQISANPLMCRKCSCTTPTVRWNLRCHIIDEKEDIKCIMNEELCQRLFRMSSVEGFKKLMEDKEFIRRRVEEISHLEGIFKVKINPYKDSLYYNIVDVYKNDSLALLKRAYKDLKETMKKVIAS